MITAHLQAYINIYINPFHFNTMQIILLVTEGIVPCGTLEMIQFMQVYGRQEVASFHTYMVTNIKLIYKLSNMLIMEQFIWKIINITD